MIFKSYLLILYILFNKLKYKVSNTTAYRSFENVVALINASPGKNYHFKEMLKIINK